MVNNLKLLIPLSRGFLLFLSCCLLMACNGQKKNNIPNSESKESTSKIMLTLEGVVTNNQGLPVSDVIVTILSGAGNYPDIGAMTNEKGQFSFSNLPAGTIELKFITDTQEMEKKVALKKGQTSFVFKLE